MVTFKVNGETVPRVILPEPVSASVGDDCVSLGSLCPVDAAYCSSEKYTELKLYTLRKHAYVVYCNFSLL